MLSINLWRSDGQPEIIKTWTFHHNNAVRIGRALDNDVVVGHPAVSRHHVELNRSNEGWNITNLGVNRTFWQGQPVDNMTLEDETAIQLSPGGPSLLIRILPDCDHKDNLPDSLFCQHCGVPLKVKKTIRDYQIVRVLGQGGMGITYQVWRLGKIQVLKEMNADMIRNLKARELFEREARMLSRLKHRGIPAFRDYFVEAEHKYLVMEMVYGQNLESWVMQHGKATSEQAIAWTIQLCDILNYLHSQDPPIVHRDIKPANLLLCSTDGSIKLIDFGAVKEIGTSTGTRIGAPNYSAPEQNRGLPVTQSDLYAIAPTLVSLLTGQTPMNFMENRGYGSRFYCEGIPGVSSELSAIITKLSAPSPSDRYLTALELAEALRKCH